MPTPRFPVVTVATLSLSLAACPTGRVRVVELPPPPPRVATPAPVDPNVVQLEAVLGNAYVAAGTGGAVTARLRVNTTGAEHARRAPLNVALVVDTSGSMEGDAIDQARAASEALLDTLAPGDQISVVAFHSRTEVLLPTTRIGDGRAGLRSRVAQMQAQGTTDMAGGLTAGLAQLAASALPEGANRIVLLSDGVPNEPGAIQPLAQSAAARGVTITALGLGLDYDETLLGAVALQTGGRFHYVERPEQVAQVFRDEVLRLRRVVAHNAVVTLSPGPGVHIAGVVGRQFAVEGGTVSIPLGDVTDGEPQDLIVRLTAPARRPGATVEVLDATLSFDDAVQSAGHLERHAFLGARSTADAAALASHRDPTVERDAVRFQTAARQVEAIQMARNGQVTEAQVLLTRAEAELRAFAQPLHDAELLAEAATLARLRATLPALTGRVSVAAPAPGAAEIPSSASGALAQPPAEAPVASAAPAPPARPVRGGAHGPAARRPAPAAAATPAAPRPMDPDSEQLARRAHDDAVRTISGH